jgi:hypothetical protein
MQVVPSHVYGLWPLSKLQLLPLYGDFIILSAFFMHLVYLLGCYLSSMYSSSYQKLSSSKQASWSIHIVSQVFSIIVLTLCIPILSNKDPQIDKLFGTDLYSSTVYAFAAGYFLWDTIITIYYISETGAAFIFHGLSCFLVFFTSFVSPN